MASNEQLISEIKAIDPEAKTDGLNNAQLAEMKKQLKEAADGDQETDEREAAAKADKEKADEEAAAERQEMLAEKRKKAEAKLPELKKGEHRVAKGKAVTTKKGVKAWPHGVAADDLSGGEKSFRKLLKNEVLEA